MANAAKGSMPWFKAERGITAVGLLGFLLAALCGGWALLGGEASLAKAASFNAAIGIFLLSTAAILPVSGLRSKGKAFFRYSYMALALYSYFAETVQHARGVNPRFVIDGTAFDTTIANGFAAVAILLVVYYLVLAASFFRRRVYEARPELTLGVRYAMASVVVSFAGGIWISVNGGSTVGLEGNWIWLHGLGFHALQALPIMGWLAAGSMLQQPHRLMLIHISGVAFLLCLGTMAWQTLLGRSLLELSALPLAAAAFLLVVAAAMAKMLLEWRRSKPVSGRSQGSYL